MNFMNFFKKRKVKLSDRCIDTNTMQEVKAPPHANDCINVAFNSCQEIVNALEKNKIESVPFFYIFYVDLIINLAMSGRYKIAAHYLNILKDEKEKRKKANIDYIKDNLKKNKLRDELIDVLKKI